MKAIRFDSVGGASGNMVLGALVDLGADLDPIKKTLESMEIGAFEIQCEKVSSHGLHGTCITVIADDPPATGHGHVHRHLADVRALVEASSAAQSVKDRAMAVFAALAAAEGKVHGKDPEKVHFHEVGAIDSIIDVFGSCLALDQLGVEAVSVGPLPLGRGTVQCAHGEMPLPVPAVVELLKGRPCTQTDEPFELVTPTGAALLANWTQDMPASAEGRILESGTGFGTRTLEKRPNLLRASLIETAGSEPTETCWVMECDVDDTTPELLGDLSTRLLDQGALDVVLIPVQMKKGRPGTRLSVLCRDEKRSELRDLVFRGATTFGLREYSVVRTVLDRRHEEVKTVYGPVRLKVAILRDKDVTWAPEMEDCIRLADEHNVPARTIYEAAFRAAGK